MNWEIILLLTGLSLFSYWLNYIMGGPLSDDVNKIDVKAILFNFPYFLAIRRLKKLGIYGMIYGDLIQELAMTKDVKTKYRLKMDKRRDIYLAGREFFTWERSFLCPICLHWWLTLLVGAVLFSINAFHARADFFLAAFVYLANHLLIRKIS